ncbi:MAG: glycosyltransferase family 39 protein [Phycisphaerales bacterium]
MPIGIGAFFLLFRLSDIAGLHRDEATFGLFAEQIQAGFRPLRGYFNFYTSPIHSYIIAAFFSIFGESIWSLRLSGVIFNLVSVCAYIDVLRRMFPREAFWTLWFLVTLPAFVIMARIAGENYAMNPLFLFGGIWCFYVLGIKGKSKWVSRSGYFLTGFSFFLGCWNHIVFVPSALTVIIVYLILSKTNPAKMIIPILWFSLGVIIGALPKLWAAVFLGYPLLPTGGGAIRPDFQAAILNFINTLGGDALYIRACGEIIFPFNRILPLCLLASIGILFFRKVSFEHKKLWIAAASCTILSFLGTAAITPGGLIGSRIWLLPLWFVPLVFASALAACPKKIRFAIGTIIIIANIAAISTNYFYKFIQDGGLARESVYVGGRYDNSCDFIDMRPTVKKLSEYNGRPIYIEDFNINRLKFLLPEEYRCRARLLKELFTDDKIEVGSLIAFLNLPDRDFPPKIEKEKFVGIKNGELSTNHYIVFEIVEVK